MHLAENVMHFARILRGAGLPVGPDRVLDALRALQISGLRNREDFYWTLASIFLDRREQFDLYNQAFHVFWRDRAMLDRVIALGSTPRPVDPHEQPLSSRLADSLAANRPGTVDQDRAPELEVEALLTVSDRERLQKADFESMTTAEYELAKTLAEQMPLPVEPVRRRRHEPANSARDGARLDLRATLQRMARQPHTLAPRYTRPREETPALVVLLDISGSMDRYSRLMLHYVHGLMRRALKVHTLTFGTRLTNITRCLAARDPDVALKLADEQVQDWKGGTRIASSLEEFNRLWARRLLGANAALLLVTDGLDRDEHGDLSAAAAQLHRLAHRVVWLNPLLRYEGFEAKASGVRALLPHVDRFLPVHNLASLADLGAALRSAPVSPHTLLH